MASPSPNQYPADCPAALSVSLPLHCHYLFDPAPNAKNPRGTRPCGFRSGCISPVDFSLMPQGKEQIKNFFEKLYMPPEKGRESQATAAFHLRQICDSSGCFDDSSYFYCSNERIAAVRVSYENNRARKMPAATLILEKIQLCQECCGNFTSRYHDVRRLVSNC
ncbi:hypothetical protein ACFOY8_15920 [Thalassospira xianhensis]|uniref:hypothetical protein n=1 Tax=Thalassospira xianhensis TaxID=478503 RepID=UPI00360BA0D8